MKRNTGFFSFFKEIEILKIFGCLRVSTEVRDIALDESWEYAGGSEYKEISDIAD